MLRSFSFCIPLLDSSDIPAISDGDASLRYGVLYPTFFTSTDSKEG